MTYFYILGPPLYLLNGQRKIELQIWCADWSSGLQTKDAKVGEKGRGLGHLTYLYNFWDSFYISGMGKVNNFKFGVQIGRQAYKPKNAKVGQSGLLL